LHQPGAKNGDSYRDSGKQKVCAFFQQGFCKFGNECRDAHVPSELTRKMAAISKLEEEVRRLKQEIKEKSIEYTTLKNEIGDA